MTEQTPAQKATTVRNIWAGPAATTSVIRMSEIADALDAAYPNDPDPQMQADLRHWADLLEQTRDLALELREALKDMQDEHTALGSHPDGNVEYCTGPACAQAIDIQTRAHVILDVWPDDR